MNKIILINLHNLPKINKNTKLSKNISFLYKLKNKYPNSTIKLTYINNNQNINNKRTSPW